MELILKRAYFPKGTNGSLFESGAFICFTIELPWQENRYMVSCIPEGKYQLKRRYTEKHGWHLMVTEVLHRSGILIHPANDAQKELEGCIAPVTMLSGIGTGTDSRKADSKLKKLVFAAIDQEEDVFLTIKNASI